MNTRSKQQGFTLFIVLIIMLVIAFMVIAGVRSINTESRISANDADRKIAFALAESALNQGENYVLNPARVPKGSKFNFNCANGLCAPAGGVAPPPAELSTGKRYEEYFSTDDNRAGQGACTGLCPIPAWERTVNGNPVLGNTAHSNSLSQEAEVEGEYSKKPRFIVEYLNAEINERRERTYFFRITSRAWGKNPNTVVTLQSYIEVNFE